MSAIGCKIEHKEKLSINSSVGLKFRGEVKRLKFADAWRGPNCAPRFPKDFYESG